MPLPSQKPRTTVLVVDDEEIVRRYIALALGEAGFRVLTAADAEEAIFAVASAHDPVDLLIIDVHLKERAGREAAEQLARYCHGKVLYTSGSEHRGLVASGKVPADADFLSKPFSPDDLVNRVREASSGG